jgi:hypothetical protein
MKVVSIKSVSAKRGQEKADKDRKMRSLKGKSYLSEGHQLKIQQRYLDGESIDRIARETGHTWRTISKIVRVKRLNQHIEMLREKLYGQMDEILLACVIQAKIGDGTLAYRLLVDAGVIPQLGKKTVDMNVSKVPPESEDDIVHDIARELIEGAVERHKFFNMPLPEFDEIEDRLKKEKEKKAASLQS